MFSKVSNKHMKLVYFLGAFSTGLQHEHVKAYLHAYEIHALSKVYHEDVVFCILVDASNILD